MVGLKEILSHRKLTFIYKKLECKNILFDLLCLSVRYLCKLQEFPSSFPPNQVDEIQPYHCMVEGCHNQICSHAISDVLKHLPAWVEPHMVYFESSIETKQVLGRGQYGTVHQGLFRSGHAV